MACNSVESSEASEDAFRKTDKEYLHVGERGLANGNYERRTNTVYIPETVLLRAGTVASNVFSTFFLPASFLRGAWPPLASFFYR